MIFAAQSRVFSGNNTFIIYFTAAIFSLLLSIWLPAQQAVINPDAICYLQSAATFNSNGLHAAAALCDQAKWPFYSIMIAEFVKVTHLSYEMSAFVLNGLFSLIAVLSFITIVKMLGGTRQVLWLAVLVILLAHDANSVRQYIIRDHGYWAFYLLSLVFLLQYFRKERWSYALAWNISLLVATLFRVEGVIFLALIPFSVWFYPQRLFIAKLKSFCQLYSLLGLVIILVLIGVLAHPQWGTEYLSRLAEVKDKLFKIPTFIATFHHYSALLAENILSTFSKADAGLVLALTLSIWYVLQIVASLSWIYTLLFLYAVWKRLLRLDAAARVVLAAYLLLNIGITGLFFVENMFLSKRYLLGLSLLFMLWVPFALADIIKAWRQRRPGEHLKALLLPLVSLFILVTALGGIFEFGYSKAYILAAGKWLSIQVPADAKLYSNDLQLMYYSGHFDLNVDNQFQAYQKVLPQDLKNYDYVALRIKHNENLTEEKILLDMGLQPVQVFTNKRGDAVKIFVRTK